MTGSALSYIVPPPLQAVILLVRRPHRLSSDIHSRSLAPLSKTGSLRLPSSTSRDAFSCRPRSSAMRGHAFLLLLSHGLLSFARPSPFPQTAATPQPRPSTRSTTASRDKSQQFIRIGCAGTHAAAMLHAATKEEYLEATRRMDAYLALNGDGQTYVNELTCLCMGLKGVRGRRGQPTCLQVTRSSRTLLG